VIVFGYNHLFRDGSVEEYTVLSRQFIVKVMRWNPVDTWLLSNPKINIVVEERLLWSPVVKVAAHGAVTFYISCSVDL
jgi:hypothetical protein